MDFGKQYIKAFANTAAYASFVNSSDFVRPNVSYCISENKVFYTPIKSPINASIGDYLYSDFTVGTAVSQDKTIIGVCVIPTGKLADGKARFMSIKCMNVSTPETGSSDLEDSDSYMYWGGYERDIDTLKNYNRIIYKVNGTSTLAANTLGYLKLNSAYSDALNNIPSPHTEFDLYKNTAVTEFNCLSDFDGFGNTAKILAVDDIEYGSWREDDTVDNSDSDEYIHPAARCCYLYHTKGTSQGDWYLPAMGELGFLAEKRDEISAKLVAAGGPNIASVQPWLWSSTEDSRIRARYLYLDNGYADIDNKVSGYQVFAFLAI